MLLRSGPSPRPAAQGKPRPARETGGLSAGAPDVSENAGGQGASCTPDRSLLGTPARETPRCWVELPSAQRTLVCVPAERPADTQDTCAERETRQDGPRCVGGHGRLGARAPRAAASSPNPRAGALPPGPGTRPRRRAASGAAGAAGRRRALGLASAWAAWPLVPLGPGCRRVLREHGPLGRSSCPVTCPGDSGGLSDGP